MKQFLIVVMVLLLASAGSKTLAQITKEDYARADSVMKLNELVYNQVSEITWIDSSSVFWYRIKTRDGIKYQLVDAQKGSKKIAFDTEKLVEALNTQLDKKTSASELILENLKFTTDKKTIDFSFQNVRWTCELKNYTLIRNSEEKPREPRPYWGNFFDEKGNDPVVSPDKLWTAFIRNDNVYIRNNEDNKEYQLSYDGAPGDFYSSYISWSPDSKKLAVNRVRDNVKRQIYYVESSPDSQLQPILRKRDYQKPGDDLAIRRPCLFDVESKKQIPVNTAAFDFQYNLSLIKWRTDASEFTFEFNQRGHQVYQVVEVDAETGEVRILADEHSKTFIDYSGKRYRYDLEETNEMLWASERDGWNHLYLIDTKDGSIKNQVTKGEWVVRNVLHVDEENRTIFFYGSGKNSDEDPYYLHCYKVNFDGSGLTDLTPEKMNHEVSFSGDLDYFADTYSTVETPPVTVVRSSVDGKVQVELERTDISDLLAAGWNAPEPFVAKARDGKTDIWGNIYRPINFDENKSYPIIEYIYAGPHSSFTQKSFQAVHSAFSAFAQLGFIIVKMDGMGTSNRSKAFQDVCYKNLKDAGFPDRILWIKAAAEKYSYMDTSRVGLFGRSAGGQNTLSGLLFHPEFYKVGVSSCGCHDNRMDKIWWNEQWMGYPIGPEYAECSNVDNAHKLQGKLMLIVGELDENVDPASTMQVADALIKANKDFELVLIPGAKHALSGRYDERKMSDFFVRHFLKQETPDWNAVTSK
ncbi:DPP IV N-terminal domain-containing protein [Draconibacterium sp. IB214405]|uniref:S9 family peptidase n=1 Tax=Draconibacterium sp. IB214405 TaxID=3097352 RepID=UPI002A10B1CB|nr:DPP IV N-terminal domain-containing protein [Draconibacterium sp. IB214405]MDX8338987.1 DPP IV N-terminal domain-containing protein [Draconibacterium sp. IB214405]